MTIQSIGLDLRRTREARNGAAIFLQAFFFGALHLYQGFGGAVTATTIGLVLGFVWLFTGRNLWAGIVIHGLFDFSAMTAIYLGAMPIR